jgi:uncharacterized protein
MRDGDHKPDSRTSRAQSVPPATAEGIAEAARAAGRRGTPPVHLWDPPFCGDLDIRIARDGTWHYLGTPIGREALVRLFASILKREGDRHFLVTPVEKVGIVVEDAPFVAVDMHPTGEGRDLLLTFVTNVGDVVSASGENPLRVEIDAGTGEPAPYLHVRRGLEARIDRKTFYRMVDLAVEHETGDGRMFGIWSSGVFFPFLPAEALAGLSG